MRALVVMCIVLSAVVGISLFPAFSAQSDVETRRLVLFFDHTTPVVQPTTLADGLLNPPCGQKMTYHLAEAAPDPGGKAHLNRAAAAALSCETDFPFRVTRNFTLLGPVRMRFPIGCEIIGVAQSLPPSLPSVEVSVLHNGVTIASGKASIPSTLPVSICMGGPDHVRADINATRTPGTAPPKFAENDQLVARVNLRAINTEGPLQPYWFLQTGPNSKVESPIEPEETPTPPPTTATETTEPTPTPTTTTTPPPTTTSSSPSTSPSPSQPPPGSPPSCQRDEPEEAVVPAEPGETFSLRARCTDPDDDLDSGDWVVDDEVVETEDLGDSPATAEREFRFDDEGDHEVRFEPRDEQGHDGAPAVWTVAVDDGPPAASAPSCQRDEPEEFEIQRRGGSEFTLRARCTDPDDDLESGEWRIDGSPVERQPLGESPSTAKQEFTFEDEGEHRIDFIPRDQRGAWGPAASWRVHVGPEASPTTTPIPFFPSWTGLALGAFGALAGAFLILRRRPASP